MNATIHLQQLLKEFVTEMVMNGRDSEVLDRLLATNAGNQEFVRLANLARNSQRFSDQRKKDMK